MSNVKSRCFWNKLLLNGILLNKRVGWSNFLIFLLNITSCPCLLKSGLKIIFHWKGQLVTAFRSWLKIVALVWMLFTTVKRDVSSAKSLQFEKRSLYKLFTLIRTNKGPKIEPYGTPSVTLSQDECWPFRTTCRFRQERKSHKSFKRFPEIPFWFSLRSKP